MKALLLLLGSFLILCTSGQAVPPRLTYPDLVQRLYDLEHLATLPEPGESTRQWSSYDRASRYEPGTGRYVNWDANGDGHGIIRTEGEQQVLAEMTGPGCIWRIWSATPKQGHVKIYLDGSKEPLVDLPFIGYFDRSNPPFNRPALVHTVARGWNNYTPIPYQTSCRIVADSDWGDYFHFVYTTFPAGTQVPTFSRDLGIEGNAALDQANRILSDCGPLTTLAPIRATDRIVGGNGGSTTMTLRGPGAVACIRAKVELPPRPADREALRELVLEIRWDGEAQPSVWCPLGDFFGTAPGVNVYRSLPAGMTEDGWFYANWSMPFGKSAEIRVINEGKNDRHLALEVYQSSTRKADAAKLARFHAKWHRDEFLPTEPERTIDWTLLKTTGRGRFVGVMLHVWNPRGGWWGEGDEKFFVDGEKFPSTIGTGSEDYFGYAWCDPQLFQNAFHNQTHNDGNNRGHVSVNRWHIADQVPFQNAFEGCIEKYYANARPTLYASTVFWYLEAGGQDLYAPRPLGDRTSYYVAPIATRTPGAIEGESLKVLSKTRGNPQEQDMTIFGDHWSNDAHLWWTGAGPGDKLELALPVGRPATYQLRGRFTQAIDYGIVQLTLDGQPLGKPLDLYHEGVIPTDELDLGTHDLTGGQHTLTIEIVGANPRAVKNYMFALDYLKLVETRN